MKGLSLRGLVQFQPGEHQPHPMERHSPAKAKMGKGRKKIHTVMSEFKEGELESSSGTKVTSKKQAIAIALSEARRAGAKIPKKKG